MKRLFLLACIIPGFLFAQDDSAKSHPYRNFLKASDDVKCPLFFGGMSYLYMVPGKPTTSGHGLVLEGGINLARFFTKKLNVGIYGTYKSRELLWPGGFNKQFSQDLVAASDFSSLSHDDSVIASYFTRETDVKLAIGGCGRIQYGLTFRGPWKNFPMIKFYKGIQFELISTGSEVSAITHDNDWIYMKYHTTGFELTYQIPMRVQKDQMDITGFFVSIFAEMNDLSESFINGIPLSEFIAPSFFGKYDHTIRFGIKVGGGMFL